MSSESPKRPEIPPDMKTFNARIVEEFRAHEGRLSGPLEGRVLMLLTTTGARTGREHTVVLGFKPYGDGYAVIASNNGSDRAPAWYHNLMADPVATVEIPGRSFRARARVAGPEERPELARLINYFEPQQALTTREIPFVVLEPIQ
jgi:deazaflavin-dependent oxidoreductase (nitroreductase family)